MKSYNDLKVNELRKILEDKGFDFKKENMVRRENKLPKYIKKSELIGFLENIESSKNIPTKTEFKKYEWISGISIYSIYQGKIDDGILRTIYLFGDFHTGEGECPKHKKSKNVIEFVDYIKDTLINNENIIIDIFAERGRKKGQTIPIRKNIEKNDMMPGCNCNEVFQLF